MEFVVQLFRALANSERIKILRLVVVLGPMNVSELAEALALELSLVSAHLKVLAAAGLVWRRRSGRTVGYRLAESTGNEVTACALRVIQEVFAPVRLRKPRSVANATQAKSPTHSDEALFACFTAFTHPRRLQIIRRIAKSGTASLVELVSELSMCRRSCWGHLEKLERRGLVERGTAGRRTAYRLTPGSGAPQQSLMDAVVQYLRSTDQ